MPTADRKRRPDRGKQTNITGRRLRHAVRRADLPAVSETRGLLRDHLRNWGVPALSDTAELLATELLTNALQHTGGGAVLTATLTPGPGHRLRVEVHDSLTRRPGPPAPGAVARALASGEHGTSGRGLILVEALADSWGAQARDGGKVVWFELEADAEAA
ncbi:ATP-binding protein [Streptomyces sp. SID4948]|nr:MULTISPECIES: ATP-binding protein [unclassified Streptomyces]MYS22749.1 ATP-binding protein [Streptomyces sp. SID4948]